MAKERYVFETRRQESKRLNGRHKDMICVSLNTHPELSQWTIEKARECGITRAEVVRQCIAFIMAAGRPHE